MVDGRRVVCITVRVTPLANQEASFPAFKCCRVENADLDLHSVFEYAIWIKSECWRNETAVKKSQQQIEPDASLGRLHCGRPTIWVYLQGSPKEQQN